MNEVLNDCLTEIIDCLDMIMLVAEELCQVSYKLIAIQKKEKELEGYF